MKRITSQELLDDDRGEPCDLEDSLDDLWRINRHWGGVSGMLRLLNRFFTQTGAHPVSVLDVGAGDGRMAAFLSKHCEEHGIAAKFFALDRRASHLHHRRPAANGLRSVAADVFHWPFAPGSFDLVTCNLFFHHFSGEKAIQLVRGLAAEAREAVLINDLNRCWLPYVFVRYAPFIARSPITRFDGAASVRQAYTASEVTALFSKAGVQSFEVTRLPFFRIGAILWKPRGAL